jgi:hypothetical protein
MSKREYARLSEGNWGDFKAMKVIFLDFDGVLNSETSFLYEKNRRTKLKEQGVKGHVNETLSLHCAAAFQWVLDCYPDVKVVLSTTWRNLFTMDWLKAKLEEYHIDSSRIIGKTPIDPGGNRGLEINTWLTANPEVTHYAIIDDNDWGITSIHGTGRFVWTNWYSGMHMGHAYELKDKLSNWHKDHLDVLGKDARLPEE